MPADRSARERYGLSTAMPVSGAGQVRQRSLGARAGHRVPRALPVLPVRLALPVLPVPVALPVLLVPVVLRVPPAQRVLPVPLVLRVPPVHRGRLAPRVPQVPEDPATRSSGAKLAQLS